VSIDLITMLDHYVMQRSKFRRNDFPSERADNFGFLEWFAIERVDRDDQRIIHTIVFADTALQNKRADGLNAPKTFLRVKKLQSDFAVANSSVVMLWCFMPRLSDDIRVRLVSPSVHFLS